MHSQPKMQFLKLRSNGSQSISVEGAWAETLGAEADDFATRVSIKALHYLIALADPVTFRPELCQSQSVFSVAALLVTPTRSRVWA